MDELDRLQPPEVRREINDAWRRLESATEPAEMMELIGRQAPFHFKDPRSAQVVHEVQRYRDRMIHTPEVNRYMSATEISDFDWEDSLEGIDQPVLILSGRFERTCPVEASEFMAKQIPGSELFIFEDSAHVSYAEERDSYIDVVRRFLRRTLS
jgi:pimeloyl-ACP methyl ester carboxylesterase